MYLKKLKKELKALRRAFELSGGRGIEIAEAIDRLEEEVEQLETLERKREELKALSRAFELSRWRIEAIEIIMKIERLEEEIEQLVTETEKEDIWY